MSTESAEPQNHRHRIRHSDLCDTTVAYLLSVQFNEAKEKAVKKIIGDAYGACHDIDANDIAACYTAGSSAVAAVLNVTVTPRLRYDALVHKTAQSEANCAKSNVIAPEQVDQRVRR